MTKRILSAMMCAVILFSLTEVSGAYATSPEFDLPETDTGYIEEVTGTDENEIVDYIDENVDVILLPEDGSMPDYIKYAEFDDGSIYIADGYGDVSEIPDQADEAWDDDMIPIKFPPLSAEGAFESTGIELCADIDTAPVHIQIYDDENDVSVFDADFPILESEIITLIEDKEYSISLVFDYGDFARGYYGSISVIDGNVEELGAWEITTERVVPDDVDSAVESYDSIVNEREPNNSYGSATNYKNNDDMYGTISSASDVDYYKVDFGRDGKANFYLGNIPEDCNYDLKIYSQPVSGGTPVLYRTLSTSKDYEQVQNLPVESNKVYYMQVYSQNKTYSSNSKYQVRAKITPSDDNYEPNNTRSTATSFPVFDYVDATIHKPSDVDYYEVTPRSGVLTVKLSKIPYGCDFRFAIYDSYGKLIDEMTQSGDDDKELSIACSYEKHYIKVYSHSGSSQASKYHLSTKERSSNTFVSGYIKADIKEDGSESSKRVTPIAKMPVQFVCTLRDDSSAQRLLATTTSDNAGHFNTSFNLPNDADSLFVRVYPQDTSLSIQKLDATVSYTLFEIPINATSISFDSNANGVSEQFRVAMSLWQFGKNGLSEYKSVGSHSCGQLVVRCTAGTVAGTAADNSRIVVNGSAQNLDYYDYDIFLHEMGHWIMRNMGGRPAGDGVNHTWGTPSNPRTAYIEGWAHYFSAIMRDEPTVYDYDSTGHYFGGNLKTGYVKASSSSSHTEKIEKQTPYSKNMEYEANVGSALWNLSDKYSTYREMERVMKNPRANWQEFYDAYMNNITANEEGAWNICENFNIAFDLEVPQVTLFISDNIASMTASDNVAVKSYEWYVDGSLVSSGNGASSSIALNALGLNSGTHTVECRVYDAEGLASGDRPRQERYGSASKSFQIVGGSELLNENISDKLPELSPIENAESVVSEAMVLSVGEEQQQAIITPGNMDIVIQMAAKGAIRSIDIISPDGKLYDTLYHIAPDAPYKISNAQAGEWTILISAFTGEDVAELPKVQGSAVDSQDTVINSTVDMQLQISLMPSPVEIDIPNITADSYILEEFLADESIVVTENDQTLDKSLPLEDGIHELCVVREIDGLISEAREYSVTVDTTPPELSFADLPNETNRDRVVLFVNCSEAMSDLMINGTSVELFDCGAGDEYNDVYLLDHGDNYFDITVTDLAGNSSSQTICVTRTS